MTINGAQWKIILRVGGMGGAIQLKLYGNKQIYTTSKHIERHVNVTKHTHNKPLKQHANQQQQQQP